MNPAAVLICRNNEIFALALWAHHGSPRRRTFLAPAASDERKLSLTFTAPRGIIARGNSLAFLFAEKDKINHALLLTHTRPILPDLLL